MAHKNNIFPLIQDISTVVPASFCVDVPVPADLSMPPNALRSVCQLGGSPPAYPTDPYPYQFTIPGNTLEAANSFAAAMSATVRWKKTRTTETEATRLLPRKGCGKRPSVYFKLEYVCSVQDTSSVPKILRKTHPTIKHNCKSRFSIAHHIQTNYLHNHNPNHHEDMLVTRAPIKINNWLKEQVVSGLRWDFIGGLAQCSDFADKQMATPWSQPEGLHISYDQVQHLTKKLPTTTPQMNGHVLTSLAMWAEEIWTKGWSVFTDLQDDEHFIFVFMSPWQKSMLLQHGQGIAMVDATHNTIQNCFLESGKKVCLYTIIIRGPIVGQGLPVAWTFTDLAAEEPLSLILRWIQRDTGHIPRAWMSDCALAITAIKDVYSDLGDQAPKHYYIQRISTPCLQHLFPHHPLEQIPLKVAHCQPAVCCIRLYAMMATSGTLCQHPPSLFHRPSIKAYTEAWHGLLKRKYLPAQGQRRIDKVVKVFVNHVKGSCRWTQKRAESESLPQQANKFQQCAQRTAASLSQAWLKAKAVKLIKTYSHNQKSSFQENNAPRIWQMTFEQTYDVFSVAMSQNVTQSNKRAKLYGVKDTINTTFIEELRKDKLLKKKMNDLDLNNPTRLYSSWLKLLGTLSMGYNFDASHPTRVEDFPIKTVVSLRKEDQTTLPNKLADLDTKPNNISQIAQIQINKHDQVHKGVFVAVGHNCVGELAVGMIDLVWEVTEEGQKSYVCKVIAFKQKGVDDFYEMQQLVRTRHSEVISARVEDEEDEDDELEFEHEQVQEEADMAPLDEESPNGNDIMQA
ncbi:hypothetical protein MJO28_003188 [Puccinia striiformis f. sp. tritici]|uniref:Uncharacterized protein n=1 Tax=Puccinia striiformis f. sp. tritici TaxID=168172 RepID=A0ACC0ES01_9BASI|nr:hypothetical protein MJO28_003188 [Puccinia striiformis f. sp. tritici]